MKTHVSFLFGTSVLLWQCAGVSADCAPQPILFPVTNVTVNQGLVSRGIKLSIGTPAQNFSFLPSVTLNNSYVYDSTLSCSGKSSKYCATDHGGWYNAQSSTSRKDSSADGLSADVNDYGGWPFNASAATWVTDNLTLSSNSSLNGLPIGIPKAPIGNPNYQPLGAVGVSAGSALLNSLANGNLIAARVWSFFYGQTGASSSTQSDGHFIMGGYDSQRVQGTGYNFSMGQQPTDCTYPVTIEDMTLDFPNGTSASIFSGSRSAALSACIDPTFPVLMSMPTADYFENFIALTGMTCNGRSLGVNYYGATCDIASLYPGDFSIKIKGGPKVTVPNSQLLIPDMTLADDGTLVANQSSKELIINPIQEINANDTLQLGRQFFTAAYMMANLDRSQFTLWQARTNAGVAPQLVAVDKNGAVITTFCSGAAVNNTATANTTSPVVTSTPSTAAASTSAPASNAGNSVSGGAIAGIAVGVTAAVAAVAGLLFWLLRRHRPGAEARGAEVGIVGAGPGASSALRAGHESVLPGYAEKGPGEGTEKAPLVAHANSAAKVRVAEMPVGHVAHEMPAPHTPLLPAEPQELP